VSGGVEVRARQEPLLASAEPESVDGPALEKALQRMVEHARPRARMVAVRRRPLERASSWWMEGLTIELHDGRVVELVFKDLGREAPGSAARLAKPARVRDPERELWVYRHVLEPLHLGTPRCLGIVSEPAAGRHWLFLEPVAGSPLWETAMGPSWTATARWLARFHAGTTAAGTCSGPLIRHSARFHRGWFRRAVALAHVRTGRAGREGTDARERLEGLAAISEMHLVAARAVPGLARGFVHGEFYPSNVLVTAASPHGVRPVDWEMAGRGPLMLDLAALTAGGLTSDERAALLDAYHAEARRCDLVLPAQTRLRRELLMCRLLQAVQWLGWGRDWVPPREHRNDWMKEARQCARELAA
jgi:Ser/Thr protein kinase RdoA (MazF antagonist)